MAMRFVNCRWTRSLRRQLLATYVAGLLLTVGAIALGLGVALHLNTEWIIRHLLWDQAKGIERCLDYDAKGGPPSMDLSSGHLWIYTAVGSDLEFRVVDASGQVVLSSDHAVRALAPEGRSFDPALGAFDIGEGEHQMHVLTVPLARSNGRFHLQVSNSERLSALAARAVGKPLLRAVLILSLVSMLVFSIAVFFTLRRMLRPLGEASAAAARIQPRNLSARLTTKGLPAELDPLVNTFNQALDRLENGYRVQQEFLAGAAHELKTPLALIRAQIEMSGTADRATLLQDVDFMARQIHQLLHLAEVSESHNYVYESVHLGAVASDVIHYLQRLAEQRQIDLRLVAAPDAPALQADQGALFILAKNLVENAIAHAPVGSVVTLTVNAQGLAVRDEGAGVADDDLPKLFTRFWRGPGRRDQGAGLGLAICQEIATAHDWRLEVRQAEPGAEFALRVQAAALPTRA